MKKSLTIIATVILTLAVAMTSFAATTASAPAASSKEVININTADASQLALLPRVGAKAAQRIVDYRKEHGPFKKTTDLMQVKGIGDKSFELLSAYLVVDGKTTLSTKQHGPKQPRRSKTSKSNQNAPANPAQ